MNCLVYKQNKHNFFKIFVYLSSYNKKKIGWVFIKIIYQIKALCVPIKLLEQIPLQRNYCVIVNLKEERPLYCQHNSQHGVCLPPSLGVATDSILLCMLPREKTGWSNTGGPIPFLLLTPAARRVLWFLILWPAGI